MREIVSQVTRGAKDAGTLVPMDFGSWLRSVFTRGAPKPEQETHATKRHPSKSATVAWVHRRRAREAASDREKELREALRADPNDAEAFDELSTIVCDRAERRSREEAEEHGGRRDDSNPTGEIPRVPASAGSFAVWSLCEELAQRPDAWYPLIVLARLSLDEDPTGALHRYETAVDRDPTGGALAASVEDLVKAGKVGDGVALGVGHWKPAQHVPEAGAALVRASLAAGSPADAEFEVGLMADNAKDDESRGLVADLQELLRRSR